MKKESSRRRRGRPRKVLGWVLRRGENQSKWEDWFRSVGHPQELGWNLHHEVCQEGSLPAREHDIHGRRTRPTKDVFGESADHRSISQPHDPFLSHLYELAEDETVVLSEAWRQYLEFMDVIVGMLRGADRRAALKKLVLEDARSRQSQSPPDLTLLGTPAEFATRCANSHVEIRLRPSHRDQLIEFALWDLPPDEWEELDDTEEPPGHWEGLKWVPDKTH